MRRSLLVLVLMSLSFSFVACDQEPAAVQQASMIARPVIKGTYADDPVRRGQYLVRIGSCNDCHTPWVFDQEIGVPRPDMTRMLSGHPKDAPDPQGTIGPGDMGLIGPTFTSFALPFGTVYSANLTPDPESGIGTWTEEMFLDIFRKGRHLGGDGRPVLPPMPWFWIRNMSDDDLKAVYAYLKSVPPIYNVVPSPKVPDEVLMGLRDGLDRFAEELPKETWASRRPNAATPAE
ncbi:MAG TPA: diheme cytochrome c-553 [Thermoanaerobaculia bacterium]|nr:diheme cytochrome c-553 [Thermoanaerobaculia bacterium]